jgi:hypothetical protein
LGLGLILARSTDSGGDGQRGASIGVAAFSVTEVALMRFTATHFMTVARTSMEITVDSHPTTAGVHEVSPATVAISAVHEVQRGTVAISAAPEVQQATAQVPLEELPAEASRGAFPHVDSPASVVGAVASMAEAVVEAGANAP